MCLAKICHPIYSIVHPGFWHCLLEEYNDKLDYWTEEVGLYSPTSMTSSGSQSSYLNSPAWNFKNASAEALLLQY